MLTQLYLSIKHYPPDPAPDNFNIFHTPEAVATILFATVNSHVKKTMDLVFFCIFVYIALLLITFVFFRIRNKINFKNLFIYGFAGSLIFFIISNFGVWALGNPGVLDVPYERNLNGLIECYILAIPFFGNTFLSTVIFAYPAIFVYKSLAARTSAR